MDELAVIFAALALGWWPVALFVVMLIGTVTLEQHRPAFPRCADDPARQRANLILGGATLAVQAMIPVAAAGMTGVLQRHGVVGLMPALRIAEGWLFAATLLAASLAQYLLHRAAHRLPWLWRLHRVHHADTALDVTTAFRHHPLEPVIGFAWLSLVAAILGLSPDALLAYGVIAFLLAIPQHADLSLGRAERWAGGWLVTPGVHHIHHSAQMSETDSNYGDVVTVWDRLFGTWQRRTPGERHALRIGLGPDHDAAAHDVRRQLGGQSVRTAIGWTRRRRNR